MMGDILQNASIIIASLSAIYGVFSWRNEHIAKQRIDLAEEVLSKMYRIKDSIRIMRSMMGFEGEGNTRKKGENETLEEKNILDKAYVIIERYNNQRESFNELFSMKYRYMAKFGKEAEQPFLIINKVLNEIVGASHILGWVYWKRSEMMHMNEDELKEHRKKRKEYEDKLWESSEDDEINKKVDEAIKYCESVSEKANSIKSFLNIFTA